MRTAALLFTFCFTVAVSLTAQRSVPSDNAKLTQLYYVDQSSRVGDKIDWVKLNREDAERRTEVRHMLEVGEVRTAADYYHAAMVFQHGQDPDAYLLAHVLAMDAVALGNNDAKWLSAATLDRYLRSIWQPQVFGTQFTTRSGEQMVQETMHPNMVSDSMRSVLCVASSKEQEQILADVHAGKPFRSTSSDDCIK